MKYLTLFFLSSGLLLFSSGCPTGTNLDDFNQCTGPAQCVLTFPGCCAWCGAATLDAVVAIHKDNLGAFHTLKRSECSPEEACLRCAPLNGPHLFAYCDQGRCKAASARMHEVGACVNDSDCKLRVGAECCEPCFEAGLYDLTAVNNSSSLESLVCDPMADCPACAPQYPPELAAFCDNGQCAVGSSP